MRRVLLFTLPWTLVAVLLAAQTWLSMYDHGHSLPRMIVYQLAVWSGWAALTPLLFAFARRVPLLPFRAGAWAVHGAAMLAVFIAHGALWAALTIVMRPYDNMSATVFSSYYLSSIGAHFTFEAVVYIAVIAIAHVSELRRRTSELKQSLAAARLHALELQIRPHFLFNTLNAVSALVRGKQNREAVEVIAGLSALLRYTLDHAGGTRVLLAEEVAMLRRYLEIQRVRFPDRLHVSIDVDEVASRGVVPTLILQPLAENAIRHGIEPSAGEGRIELRAYRRDHLLNIELFNTGSFADGARGIGLTNTEERLRQLYGKGFSFAIENARGGVMATLSVPWSERA